MRITTTIYALLFGLALLSGAGAADARIQGEGYCENQLDDCLRRSRIPEPCYDQYDRCVRNGFYAPQRDRGAGMLRRD